MKGSSQHVRERTVIGRTFFFHLYLLHTKKNYASEVRYMINISTNVNGGFHYVKRFICILHSDFFLSREVALKW